MFTDTHAHLTDSKFAKDLEQVLQDAQAAGITRIIDVTCNLDSIEKALDQEKKRSRHQVSKESKEQVEIYLSLGIHPSDLIDWNDETSQKIKELAQKNKKVVAIGEIGLDFYWEPFDAKKQKEVLLAQLELAKELELPVIIHSRSAEEETLNCIKQVGIKRGVLHCYTGPADILAEALDYGLHISFTGVVTYPKNKELQELVRKVPLEKLLLETDSPYLSPQSKRGERNEPAFLGETAKVIAELQGISLEELARVTTENAVELFTIH
ncbi:MAG: TatD family hydrolase [Candidatus Gracilibacteria bacterium]|nr:TatD family hydrolase [Candidatus Gracilibacteria bacterium]